MGGVAGGVALGPPGVIPGAVKGAKVGFAVGAATGAAVGVVTGIVQIPKVIEVDHHYKIWRSDIIKNRIYPRFQEQLRKEELFKDLVCPINQLLPEIPVVADCGHTFDKETIESWISQKNENATCPSCRKKISNDNLRINELFLKKIVERCAMYQQIEKAGLDHEIGRIDSQNDAFFRTEILRIYQQALVLNKRVLAAKIEALVESATENPEVTEEEFSKQAGKLYNAAKIDKQYEAIASST